MSVAVMPLSAVVRSVDAVSSVVENIAGYGRTASSGVSPRAVTNNPAPLLLFAVIAVAAAVVAIAIMGLAAAWLMYCTAN
ncbi:hypothetical protein [Luethyella okanaganae]|uniref:Uncharacterized protein n=1 Tax=Luethyella okanaganae TaxID=69372 RepID=A0ABW1VGT7_9MICO